MSEKDPGQFSRPIAQAELLKIAIGADHAGFAAKETIKTVVTALGYTVIDEGTSNETSVDYPDVAEKVARAVASGQADKGVLICGTGIGMSIAANKIDGIRAALVTDENTAALSRRHNDANVFCAGSRTSQVDQIAQNLTIWLQTPFEGERHARRLAKITAIEKNR